MKKVFMVPIIGIIIVVAIGSVLLITQKKTVTDAAKIKDTSITKIIFYDGRGYNKPLSVENKQKIDEFIGYMDKCIVIKFTVRDRSTGWIYSAKFFNQEKELANITFADPMTINDQHYDILDNNLSTSKIDSFLKTVSSSWKSSYH